jgi:hypothetical protein
VLVCTEALTGGNIAKAIQSAPASGPLATHGRFRRFNCRAENALILAYDDRIHVNKLETSSQISGIRGWLHILLMRLDAAYQSLEQYNKVIRFYELAFEVLDNYTKTSTEKCVLLMLPGDREGD